MQCTTTHRPTFTSISYSLHISHHRHYSIISIPIPSALANSCPVDAVAHAYESDDEADQQQQQQELIAKALPSQQLGSMTNATHVETQPMACRPSF